MQSPRERDMSDAAMLDSMGFETKEACIEMFFFLFDLDLGKLIGFTRLV